MEARDESVQANGGQTPGMCRVSIRETHSRTLLLMRQRQKRESRAFHVRQGTAHALGALGVLVIGVAVTTAVLGTMVGPPVDTLLSEPKSEATDAREQLQHVLAAEMSWHHAVLEDLAPTPAAMADTDRYVAGDIDLDELTRRSQEHRGQP